MARILIIDDDELVRLTVRHLLEAHGHVVAEAPNGREGSLLFGDGAFDIVITDILMPEKEGIETIRELRGRSPHVAIVAISGGGRVQNANYLQFAEKLGANYTISKPFTSTQLSQVIDACLEH